MQRGSVNASVDVKRLQSLFKTAAEENIQSIRNYVTDLKERVAKLHYQKQLLVSQVSLRNSYRDLRGLQCQVKG